MENTNSSVTTLSTDLPSIADQLEVVTAETPVVETPVVETVAAVPETRSVTDRVNEVINRAAQVAPEVADDQNVRVLNNMATVLRAVYEQQATLVAALEELRTARTQDQEALTNRLQQIEDSIVTSAEANLRMVSRALQDEVISTVLGASEDERRVALRRQAPQASARQTPATQTPATVQANGRQVPTVAVAPPGLS